MSELARRYATALYGLFPDVDRFVGTAQAIGDCAPLREALENPAIDWREKERVLTRLPLLSDTPASEFLPAAGEKRPYEAPAPDRGSIWNA